EFFLTANSDKLLLDVIFEAGLVKSKGDGRRLMQQSAVSIGDVRITDPTAPVPDGSDIVIKVGKRRFVKVVRN
ncbi:MAG: tyrosine--tRNA ligase, partial [Bacteroidota bacterium]|nr:tyrosine--tRNA ligase [Bacteroidota bacterium]